jgi:hypothetical protein
VSVDLHVYALLFVAEVVQTLGVTGGAAEEDRWPDSLRRHLTECDDCVATASVAPWMDRFANISDHPARSFRGVAESEAAAGPVDAGRASRPLDGYRWWPTWWWRPAGPAC